HRANGIPRTAGRDGPARPGRAFRAASRGVLATVGHGPAWRSRDDWLGRRESPMLFGNRKPRSTADRRRGAFRPAGERLESRVVLTQIDLANIAGTTAANGLGVLMSGSTGNGGAGWSVTDVGDVNGDGFNDFVITAPTVVQNGSTFNLG